MTVTCTQSLRDLSIDLVIGLTWAIWAGVREVVSRLACISSNNKPSSIPDYPEQHTDSG
ncbi:MAG TPA: hypothetical protein VFJ51_07115 [Nitrososphaeraceae archaeon]|nr:hypothetical protein [Nitrososphaeraceae archaeon]